MIVGFAGFLTSYAFSAFQCPLQTSLRVAIRRSLPAGATEFYRQIKVARRHLGFIQGQAFYPAFLLTRFPLQFASLEILHSSGT